MVEIDSLTHRKQDGKSIKHKSFDATLLNEQLAQRCKFLEGETRGPSPNFITTGFPPPYLTLAEVENVLKTCKRTSPGPGEIPFFVFRDFWMILAPHFLYVWNLSLQSGVFPQCYKKANIYALPKVKNAKEMKQLRGISVTPIIARLFEKVVYRRWVSENIWFRGDPLQFAYKKSLSTIDYLLTMQYLILKKLDNLEVDGVHVVAIDFSMAFDRVNQEMAGQRYDKFIDSPFISKWLYDFTIDRSQRLIWKTIPCDYISIDRGCAQGTVCGPSIFSMLTDDVTCLHESCHLLKYSYDMSCMVPCKKRPSYDERIILRDEISHFCAQVQLKGLTLNREKTKQIRFCLNYNPDCKCTTLSETIGEVSELKILGLLFQSNCLFTQHVKRLLSHLRSLLYMFKDLRLKHTSSSEMNRLFDALIVSRIRYGISVYACDNNAMKKIDAFLEKCFLKNYSTTRISAYDILKKEDQRIVSGIMENLRHPLRPVILSNQKSRTTRHNFFGSKPKTRTKIFLRSFCNRILTL